jgi:hypothetical protein
MGFPIISDAIAIYLAAASVTKCKLGLLAIILETSERRDTTWRD